MRSASRLVPGAALLVVLLVSAVAWAQPHHDHHHDHDHGEPPQAVLEPMRPGADRAGPPASGALGNSREVALLFWLVAFATVAGSLFVITRRNLIVAVMGMVGTFFATAVLYAMLFAHFMAVIQVLVYAGAIMVLFVFVVMILNRDEDHPWAIEGLFGKAIAAGALLYLLFRMGQVLWRVKDDTLPLLPEPLPALREGADPYPWGSVAAMGRTLFTDYLFPFEAVSIVLLVAVVGAILVARPAVTRPGGPPPRELEGEAE